MKNIIAITLILGSSALALGQGAVVKKYMDKYATDETFTKASISSKMFSLFAEMDSDIEDEKMMLDVVSKIKGLKAITSDKVSNPQALYKEAISDVDKAGYEELMTVTDAEENVKISIKETGGIIEELILVVGGKEKFAMVSLYGEIDLKQVSKLGSLMRIKSLKYLDNLEDMDKN